MSPRFSLFGIIAIISSPVPFTVSGHPNSKKIQALSS